MSRTLQEIMSRDGRYVVQAQDLMTDSNRPIAALRRFADGQCHEARVGGWIYNGGGHPIAQGWFSYASMMLRAGRMRDDADIRAAAVANRARKLRKGAALRRSWAADTLKHSPMSMDIGRWEREAAEYERAAKAVEEMPV